MRISNESPPGVGRELVNRELEAILASSSFTKSPQLSRFLRYVVEQTLAGNTDRLKEYQLGIDVFGRPADYDTRTDSVVRVEARQLRFRLADYYAGAGREDEVLISVPKGSYAARFEFRQAETPAQPIAGELQPVPKKGAKAIGAGLALAAMAIAILVFAVKHCHVGERLTRRPNVEARELYLKGRYYWDKRTADDLNKSVDYFTRAIVKDPGYAQAYVGLADAYNLLSEFSVMPYRDAFTRALAAAKKAVELDDSSAEAHNALAFASFWGARDPSTAENEFKRALELNPNYAQAHHWYATYLMASGRFQAALAEIEKAQELEPASKAVLADKGLILWFAGDRDGALTLLKQMEASDPSFLSSHTYLAFIYFASKDYPSYLAETKQAALLSHDPAAMAVSDAAEKRYAADGWRGMLEQMLKVQETFSSPPHRHNYEIAETCSLLGEREQALRYLAAARSEREPKSLMLSIDPVFYDLRQDKRFRELAQNGGERR